jgi:hypothetical protein
MVGFGLTALFSIACLLAGFSALRRFAPKLDPAEQAGVGGLLVLAAFGLLTLFVGLIPGGLSWGLYLVAGLGLFGAFWSVQTRSLQHLRFARPEGLDLIPVIGFGLLMLLALLGTLTPSTTSDWDSLAYHLAVPKIWLNEGQITHLPWVHHSNFPFSIDNLFIWGLSWGGESGAKAFIWFITLFGGIGLFGLVRRWYGQKAALLALPLFAGIPVVAWETGTAYIDAAHGLFAGLALLYVADVIQTDGEERKKQIVMAGLCLGFALGSKYTGLQAFAGLAAAWLIYGAIAKQMGETFKAGIKMTVIALAIASPWYVKTTINTGNPVFPFFYSQLGGEGWSDWHAEIYTGEQKTFGVGSDPADMGHAVLGLAYQPGRYVNPRQDIGGGFPTGAIGFAVLVGAFLAATLGGIDRRSRYLLGAVGIGFLFWFLLSQQSRYLTILAIPLIPVACAVACSRSALSWVVKGAAAAQMIYTMWLLWTPLGSIQLQVVLSRIHPDEYRSTMVSFAEPASVMNKDLPEGSKVALYDEVFGYLLDHEYYWANPGHSTLIDYNEIQIGDEYVDALRELGVTAVYFNLAMSPDEDKRLWQAAMQAGGGSPYALQGPLTTDDPNLRWRRFIGDAYGSGRLQLAGVVGSGLVFNVR